MKMNNVDWVFFSVDPVIFTFHNNELCVLLIQRTQEPFKGLWGLPGGRVDQDKCPNLESALQLKLKQKTGLNELFFEQLKTYGSAEMDPRGWSVTTAYLALVNEEAINLAEISETTLAMWIPLNDIGDKYILPFWHETIIRDAFTRLKDKSLYTDLPVNFMPKSFTYPMLRMAYEKILGITIKRQGFARRMDASNIFEATGNYEEGANRPSPLYRKRNKGGAYIFPGLIKGEKGE